MLGLVVVPSASTFLADVSTWSGALFTDLLVVATMSAGLIIGGMILSSLTGAGIKGVKKLTGGGRGGGRRRR